MIGYEEHEVQCAKILKEFEIFKIVHFKQVYDFLKNPTFKINFWF